MVNAIFNIQKLRSGRHDPGALGRPASRLNPPVWT
jgi:hypothetical protein